jgi:hypothetical protein
MTDPRNILAASFISSRTGCTSSTCGDVVDLNPCVPLTCHKSAAAGPKQGRVRHANQRRSPAGVSAMAVRMAVVHRAATETEITSTVAIPLLLDAGCAKPRECSMS